MSLRLSDHKVLHNIASSSSFFRFRSNFPAFFRSYFVLQILEFKEFYKTIIPFVLVGYETAGYSHITISWPTSAHEIIVKYCDLSVSPRTIICLSLLLGQLIDLLATDKSRYFAQPRSIIVKYVSVVRVLVIYLLHSTIHLMNHYPLDNLIAIVVLIEWIVIYQPFFG